MKSARDVVDHYLAIFRAGRRDEAFHGLIELNPDVVPELIHSFDAAARTETKTFILKVISEFRRPFAFAFLKQEIGTEDPRIWKLALDGLAMAQTPESVEAMSEAVRSVSDPEKKTWIAEAIRDTTMEIKRKAEPADASNHSPRVTRAADAPRPPRSDGR